MKLNSPLSLKWITRKRLLWLIGGLTLIIALSVFLSPREFSVRMGIHYEGIEKGLYPDDTRFDYIRLVEDEVLKTVFEKAGVTYDESYRHLFYVDPVIPGETFDTILEKRTKGEAYTYFPNEFDIYLKVKPFSGLSSIEADKVMNAYVEGYEVYFNDKYRYPFVSMDKLISHFDYKDYDYPEITKVFDNQFNILMSYLRILNKDDTEFVSKEGYGFKDMLSSLQTTKTLELNRINSIVSSYKLTKDPGRLILKYEYMIKRYDLNQSKRQGEYGISSELLEILKTRENNIVMPNMAGGTISIKTLDKSYDTIAEKATTAKVDAGNKVEDIAFFKREIEKLKTSRFPEEVLKKAKSDVDTHASELTVKIADWTKKINTLAEEYFDYKYEGAITQVEVNSIGFVGLLLAIIKRVLLLSIVVILLISAVYKKHPENIPNAVYNIKVWCLKMKKMGINNVLDGHQAPTKSSTKIRSKKK